MAIGKPRNHIWLINPSWVAERPKVVPSSGRIPALILKEKAVVIKAKVHS
jgi:hypothetical protein